MRTPSIILPGLPSMPSGYFLGRFDGGFGPMQLIAPRDAGAVITAAAGDPGGLSPTGVTPGSYTNANLTVGIDGRLTSASNGSGGASAGLYSQVLSTTPSAANTGLSTWANQNSAVVSDGLTGIVLTGAVAANNASIRYKAIPTPPFSIVALIEIVAASPVSSNAYGAMFGWYDGTKVHCINILDNAAGPNIFVLGYSALTSSQTAASVSYTAGGTSRMVWCQIKDDNAGNVTFSILPGGNRAQAITLFTSTKTAGYLGASGYTNVFFGINRAGQKANATLLSYEEFSP